MRHVNPFLDIRIPSHYSNNAMSHSYALMNLPPDPSEIIELIFQLVGGISGLESLAISPSPGQAYGRRVLFQDDHHEVMLAQWAKGEHCLPHDHGYSAGEVLFAKGDFVETQFRFRGRLISIGEVRSVRAGERIPVQAGEIHSCYSPTGGLSLHVYHPPISQMKVYDLIARETLTVSDDCGAWRPCEPKQILSKTEWD